MVGYPMQARFGEKIVGGLQGWHCLGLLPGLLLVNSTAPVRCDVSAPDRCVEWINAYLPAYVPCVCNFQTKKRGKTPSHDG